MSDPQRIEALEIKLAFLERSLQELGSTLMEQQRQISVLAARHRELLQQIEEISQSGLPGGERFEKPPHY
jgi:uncharacterized coiled-coil protein SlyX